MGMGYVYLNNCTCVSFLIISQIIWPLFFSCAVILLSNFKKSPPEKEDMEKYKRLDENTITPTMFESFFLQVCF